VVAVVTLDRVRAEAAPETYPVRVLEGCESALVLFAAAWHGKQDAIHVADAGLSATCVDTDAVRLGEMAEAYPADWEFVTADVFEYAARADRQWDVVSIDCPTNLFDMCAALVPLWCLLARRAVVIGSGPNTETVTPEGWLRPPCLKRSNFAGGVYWIVLQRGELVDAA
jgi:hypothetical protein